MLCPSCKTLLDFDLNAISNFCGNCGAKIIYDDEKDEEIKKNDDKEEYSFASKELFTSAEEDEEKRKLFKRKLNRMLFAVQTGSRLHSDERAWDGYLVRVFLETSGNYIIMFTDSLERDNSYLLKKPVEELIKGDEYIATLVAANITGIKGEGEPIFETDAECQRFLPPLYKMLKENGFEIEILESIPCYMELDVIDYKGTPNPQPYLRRKHTNNLLGYTIHVSVKW